MVTQWPCPLCGLHSASAEFLSSRPELQIRAVHRRIQTPGFTGKPGKLHPTACALGRSPGHHSPHPVLVFPSSETCLFSNGHCFLRGKKVKYLFDPISLHREKQKAAACFSTAIAACGPVACPP